MKPEERERFMAVMVGLAKVFEREIDGPLLDAYWLSLRRFSLEEFELAAAHLMQNNVHMPRPADFVHLLRNQPSAGEAWAKVLEHIKGAYRTDGGLDNDGPIDRAVAACGGYKSIAFHPTAYMHQIERRFAEHYAFAVEREELKKLGHLKQLSHD